MPTCRECRGTGKVTIKNELTTRCPDCDGSKHLPDSTECKRCNQWGEIGTGEFESGRKAVYHLLGQRQSKRRLADNLVSGAGYPHNAAGFGHWSCTYLGVVEFFGQCGRYSPVNYYCVWSVG